MSGKATDLRGHLPQPEDIAMRKLIAVLSTTAAFLMVGSTAFGILGLPSIDPMGAMRLDHLPGHHQTIPLWIPG